ncbi:hypothetical protein JHW43_008634 [Diplocarpon mali]|nr:hypothetical protein JHW43_008634 [Diplocarpon mali]
MLILVWEVSAEVEIRTNNGGEEKSKDFAEQANANANANTKCRCQTPTSISDCKPQVVIRPCNAGPESESESDEDEDEPEPEPEPEPATETERHKQVRAVLHATALSRTVLPCTVLQSWSESGKRYKEGECSWYGMPRQRENETIDQSSSHQSSITKRATMPDAQGWRSGNFKASSRGYEGTKAYQMSVLGAQEDSKVAE